MTEASPWIKKASIGGYTAFTDKEIFVIDTQNLCAVLLSADILISTAASKDGALI